MLMDVFTKVNVTAELDANIEIILESIGDVDNVKANVQILHGSTVIAEDKIDLASASKANFNLKQPKLWYPHRYGAPDMHEIKVSLYKGTTLLDHYSNQVGFRRAEVVQEALTNQGGKSFFFRVNNIPIFSCGSNWIPGHNFETLLVDQDYKDWVDMVVTGNQDMLRSETYSLRVCADHVSDTYSAASLGRRLLRG